MPCNYVRSATQTQADRDREIRKALEALEAQLLAGTTNVVIGDNGALAFVGSWDRDRLGVTDVCAYNALVHQNSWALQQAIANAEAISGRQINPTMIASGVHSHDGGRSWHPGH